MSKVALVALPLPVNQLYSYLINNDNDLIGYRVLVSFGTRLLTGVIVGYDENIPKIELKEIIEVLDNKPFFSSKMLEFTKIIADYYMSSWGEALKIASPPGISTESNLYILVNNDYNYDEYKKLKKHSPKSFELYNYLLKTNKNKISINNVKRHFRQSSLYSLLDNLEKKGFITIEKELKKQAQIKKIKTLVIDKELINNEEKLNAVLNKLEYRSPDQARILSYIYLKQTIGETVFQDKLLEKTQTDVKSLQYLKNKKLINLEYIEETELKENTVKLSENNELEYELNNEQIFAIKELKNAYDKKEFTPFFLYGVTGSGKTLVYLHLIKYVIDKGQSVIVLVPEISLTPQLIDRFKTSLSQEIAVLHSKMSDSDRLLVWKLISENKVKIVIGARSAIFAPMNNLGLIIVDEEQDSSYKQDSPNPKYNGRDAAIIRAKIENCTLLLGSATPSVETYYNAKIGKYKLLSLTNRAYNAVMPKIITIDMGEVKKKGLAIGSFSNYLLELITDRVVRKEGVIIFQNRRGFSPVVKCDDCNYVFGCPNCTIKLTYHKSSNQLKCHYCGYVEPFPESCKECSGNNLKIIGYGTQRIEDELSKYFKEKSIDAKIERYDLDALTNNNHRRILENFYLGKTDILVGTQIVAKGLDFDRVTLVGIINADLNLYQADFRANEKTYQLLTQVSGRAGRRLGKEGTVVIQTYSPENYSIKCVSQSQYEEFYEKELLIRKSANYPPFSRLALIEFYGDDENKVLNYAQNFKQLLPKGDDLFQVYGPFSPSISKAAGNFRQMILIKSNKTFDKNGNKLRATIKNALSKFVLTVSTSTVMMKIDIDPYSNL